LYFFVDVNMCVIWWYSTLSIKLNYRVSHWDGICSNGCGLPLYGVFVVFYHGNSDEQHFYSMLDAFIRNSAIGTKDFIRPLY